MNFCRSLFYDIFNAPISTIVSGVLQPPRNSLQRSVTVFTRPTSNPHYVPVLNIHCYKRHIALLWVSVMHTLTRSGITLVGLVPRSSVSLLLGFSAMLSVS